MDQTEFPNAPQVVMLAQHLDIDITDINKELQESPGKLFYWDGLATEAKRELSIFETIHYAKYMAHARNFARMYMKVTKLKDTVDNQMDTVILLYSKDATSAHRRKYAEACFGESESETSLAAYEELKKSPGEWTIKFKAFYQDMYKDILKDKPCFFEDIETTLIETKQKKELTEALAKAFEQRGYAITSAASNMRTTNDVDSLRLLDKKVK
jgi:uncharacterized protein (DUF488 family)